MDEERLKIDITPAVDDGRTRARLSGDLDLVSADEVKQRLSDAIDARPTQLQIDLGDMVFIDSTGLGSLVAVHHHAVAAEVPIVLIGVSNQVKRVMEMTRLDELFKFQ